jgi:hypothetical protein
MLARCCACVPPARLPRPLLTLAGRTGAQVVDLSHVPFCQREVALIKVAAGAGDRRACIDIAAIFRAKIVDTSATSITLEVSHRRKSSGRAALPRCHPGRGIRLLRGPAQGAGPKSPSDIPHAKKERAAWGYKGLISKERKASRTRVGDHV